MWLKICLSCQGPGFICLNEYNVYNPVCVSLCHQCDVSNFTSGVKFHFLMIEFCITSTKLRFVILITHFMNVSSYELCHMFPEPWARGWYHSYHTESGIVRHEALCCSVFTMHAVDTILMSQSLVRGSRLIYVACYFPQVISHLPHAAGVGIFSTGRWSYETVCSHTFVTYYAHPVLILFPLSHSCT